MQEFLDYKTIWLIQFTIYDFDQNFFNLYFWTFYDEKNTNLKTRSPKEKFIQELNIEIL